MPPCKSVLSTEFYPEQINLLNEQIDFAELEIHDTRLEDLIPFVRSLGDRESANAKTHRGTEQS